MLQRSAPPGGSRALSVDALRGLVMLAMVFVNDVAGVRAAPWWMKHFPADRSGMTFVDVVFPAFLFIVGLSVPLAIESRRRRGQGWAGIAGHILLRTLGLLLLGVFMVNMPADGARMGWPQNLWDVLVLSAGILAFMQARRDALPARRIAIVLLRAAGLAALLCLAWVYRGPGGRGIHTQWWGILGLIGWAYFVACVVYIPLRRVWPLLIIPLGLLVGLYFIDRGGAFDRLWIRQYIDFGSQIGGHGAIAVAGAMLGCVLRPDSILGSHGRRLLFALVFGTALALAAVLLHEPFGINKNAATPSWCLWSAAITCWLWGAAYFLIDAVRGPRPLGAGGVDVLIRFLVLAGINALLIYLLQPLLVRLTMLLELDFYARLGAAGLATGIARAAGLAILLTLLAGGLNRLSVRLRL